MRDKRFVLLIAGIFLGSFVTGSTIAQDTDFERGWKGRTIKPTEEGLGLDTDQDTYVSREEAEGTVIGERWEEFDLDRDERLDRDEQLLFRQGWKGKMVKPTEEENFKLVD